jgi:hypothetical protein
MVSFKFIVYLIVNLPQHGGIQEYTGRTKTSQAQKKKYNHDRFISQANLCKLIPYICIDPKTAILEIISKRVRGDDSVSLQKVA